jgi:hypothetical protein
MTTLSSRDALRFLGKRIPLSGDAPQRFPSVLLKSHFFARREDSAWWQFPAPLKN